MQINNLNTMIVTNLTETELRLSPKVHSQFPLHTRMRDHVDPASSKIHSWPRRNAN